MTKDHFRDPNLVFWMFGNIDAITVIKHSDCSIIGNIKINMCYRKCIRNTFIKCLLLSDLMITTIYGTFIKEPARYFGARGILIYSYDQRGFGAAPIRGYWPGKDAFALDLSAAARLIKARHQDVPLYLIGVSMGGAVILNALTNDNPPPATGVILVAPAVWGRETQPFYQCWALALAARVMPGMTLSGRGLNIKPSDNIPMLRALSLDPLVIKETRVDTLWGLVNLMDAALAASKTFTSKALILYGDKDEIIGQEPTVLMRSQLPQQGENRHIFKRYPNGYHMLLRGLNADLVWQDILNWIDPSAIKNR